MDVNFIDLASLVNIFLNQLYFSNELMVCMNNFWITPH